MKKSELAIKCDLMMKDYCSRRDEMNSTGEGHLKTVQIFFTGILLLISYSLITGNYLIIALVPILIFLMSLLILFTANIIHYNALYCKQIEKKINNIFNDKVITWEHEWADESNNERNENINWFLYLFAGSIILTYILFSILTIILLIKDSELLLASLLTFFYISMLTIGIIGGWKLFKLYKKNKL